MSDHQRIVLDRSILSGKPVIRGTRLSVEFIIGLLADGWTEADIFENYPGIPHDDIIACLAQCSAFNWSRETDSDVDALWARESENRLSAYRRGEMKSGALSEVLAKYASS